MKKLIIHTDGCKKKGTKEGNGAWCAIIQEQNSLAYIILGDREKYLTSNRAEMRPFIEVMKLIDPELYNNILIYSDSTYTVKGFNVWMHRWVQFNFVGKKNPDLWKEIYDLKLKFKSIKARWVKGHSSNVLNNLADRIATHCYHHGKIYLKFYTEGEMMEYIRVNQIGEKNPKKIS